MRDMYLSSSHISILFDEFNKVYDKHYKFSQTNNNEIKIYTPYSVLKAKFYVNKEGNAIIMLSDNWCSQDKLLLINSITSSYKWEYIERPSSCCSSRCCYIYFPLCYVGYSSNYNTKLIFEM
jgi:hypothetical protein